MISISFQKKPGGNSSGILVACTGELIGERNKIILRIGSKVHTSSLSSSMSSSSSSSSSGSSGGCFPVGSEPLNGAELCWPALEASGVDDASAPDAGFLFSVA